MNSKHHALCVDLDGTLLRSDLLHESLLSLLSHNPIYFFFLPFWLFKGKAGFKREIAKRVSIPPETLPFDERILELLRNTSQRPRVLCTASDELLVNPISEYLGLFDEVIASDGKINIAGKHKAEALVSRFGEKGFDYAGNDLVDLHVWEQAASAIVVGNDSLANSAARIVAIRTHLAPAPRGDIRTWIKALRIYQWAKNILVLLPLFLSHRFLDSQSWLLAGAAFLAFGLCASGVYLLNDLLDLTPDRQHARKCNRPFAAGTLPLKYGLVVTPILTLFAFAIAFLVGWKFTLVLLGYYILTMAYSLKLKRLVMIDAIVLATLYTVRIIAGIAAIHTSLSFWLLSFSMFIFLSLALLKRYTELNAALTEGKQKASGRGYGTADLPLIQSLGAAAGYIGVLVLALYINSPESMMLYRHPKLLWLLCPVLLYWISRMWVVSHRGEMDDDPIVFAAKDRTSQLVISIGILIVLAAI